MDTQNDAVGIGGSLSRPSSLHTPVSEEFMIGRLYVFQDFFVLPYRGYKAPKFYYDEHLDGSGRHYQGYVALRPENNVATLHRVLDHELIHFLEFLHGLTVELPRVHHVMHCQYFGAEEENRLLDIGEVLRTNLAVNQNGELYQRYAAVLIDEERTGISEYSLLAGEEILRRAEAPQDAADLLTQGSLVMNLCVRLAVFAARNLRPKMTSPFLKEMKRLDEMVHYTTPSAPDVRQYLTILDKYRAYPP